MNLRVGCGIDDGILIRKILVERAIDKLARCAMAFIVVPSNPCAPNREDAADTMSAMRRSPRSCRLRWTKRDPLDIYEYILVYFRNPFYE